MTFDQIERDREANEGLAYERWSEERRPQPDRAGEFGVYVVQADGNPELDDTYPSLRRALEEADALERDWDRRARESGGRVVAFIGVQDENDPERGWLDEDDLDGD